MTGVMNGMVKGYYEAKSQNVNPWTGKPNTTQKSTVSKHAQQRVSERNISQNDINEALKNPLKVTETTYDAQGRPSVKYIGSKTTVVVNPETGNIITTYPTSTQRSNSILKQNKE